MHLRFLDQLFPFHVVTDRDLQIRRVGRSLQKLCPDMRIDEALDRHLVVTHPRKAQAFSHFVGYHDLVLLKPVGRDLILRGQVVADEPAGRLYFACSVWLDDPARLTEWGLSLRDFAAHDLQSEQLHFIQSLKSAHEDARELTRHLEEQRNALQASEQLKTAILDSSLDCIVTIDAAGRVVEWNPAAEATFGWVREEVLGRVMAEFIVPESDRAAHTAGLKRYLATGEGPVLGQRIELTALRRSGDCFPIEISISPSGVDDRQRFTAYIRDITEARRDAEELDRSHRLLHAVSEAQQRFIRQAAPGDLFGHLLEMAMEITGSSWGTVGETNEGALAPVVHAILPAGESALDPAATRAIDRLMQPDAAHFVSARDRRGRDLLFLPLQRGARPVGFLGLAMSGPTTGEEIARYFEPLLASAAGLIDGFRTEQRRRQAVRLLEREKEQQDSILEGIADGVVVTDHENRVVLANSAARFLLRLNDRELVPGRSWAEAAQAIQAKTVGDAIDLPLPDHQERITLEFPEPDPLSLDMVCTRFRVEIARGDGRILVFRDVTRSREIDRMKSEFVASVSHELRTPLASIKGFSATLLKDPDIPGDTRLEFLQIINDESDRLANLIEDLLDLSRIESGRHPSRLAEVALDRVIRDVRDLLAPQFEKHGIRFEAVEQRGWTTLADEGQLVRLLQNLLSNAVKFTPEGGHVRLALEGDAHRPVLVVSDTGQGIPAESLPHIFDRFYRVRRPGKQAPGTGLGLALVREIADLHGWRIEVASDPGQGTTFRIELVPDPAEPAQEVP